MVKDPPDNAGDGRDSGWIPVSGRPPAGGNGNPLQCSCLENQSHGQRSLVGYSPWGLKRDLATKTATTINYTLVEVNYPSMRLLKNESKK